MKLNQNLKQDFTTTIAVDQSPVEAFLAINNARGWLSEEIEGNTENINGNVNRHF